MDYGFVKKIEKMTHDELVDLAKEICNDESRKTEWYAVIGVLLTGDRNGD